MKRIKLNDLRVVINQLFDCEWQRTRKKCGEIC